MSVIESLFKFSKKCLYWVCYHAVSVFMFWFFDHEVYGSLARQLWIEPTSSALEGEILTTAPPGKSLLVTVLIFSGCQDKVP